MPLKVTGEVCINGIECPADVTLRFHVHKNRPLAGPMVETSVPRKQDAEADEGSWIVVESATDAAAAARGATSRMIDLLAEALGLHRSSRLSAWQRGDELRLSQVVNEPMFTVSAAVPSMCCREGDSSDLCDSMTLKPPPNYRPVRPIRNGSSEQRCGNTDAHVLGLAACDALWHNGKSSCIDEIAAFRKGRPPANLARNVRRLDIVTFGRDYGSITLEFERNVDGKTVRGRQSQVWVRLPEGWRIVAAHVSVLPG